MRYIDSKKGLAIVLSGANAGAFDLHAVISTKEITRDRLLYDSILCKGPISFDFSRPPSFISSLLKSSLRFSGLVVGSTRELSSET